MPRTTIRTEDITNSEVTTAKMRRILLMLLIYPVGLYRQRN